MKNFSNLLAWGATALTAALVTSNWGNLIASAPLDLLQARIDVAMGANMLALSGVMVATLVFAYLHKNTGSPLNARNLPREIQRTGNVASGSEASGIGILNGS